MDFIPLDLMEKIQHYFLARGLVMPSTDDALKWAITEFGEANEVLLRRGTWIRNNPHKQTLEFSAQEFCEELGDMIMMLMIAGLTVGGDPIKELEAKMVRKLKEISDG